MQHKKLPSLIKSGSFCKHMPMIAETTFRVQINIRAKLSTLVNLYQNNLHNKPVNVLAGNVGCPVEILLVEKG